MEAKILMKIWLLTHSEELKKASGTGRLVKETLGKECEIIVWSRVAPDEAILNLSPSDTLLIYLCENEEQKAVSDSQISKNNTIIIDGTWQQARKIYNQSPYLQKFKHHEIQGVKSVYNKRRNQKNIGLCTAEVAIHILTEYKHPAAEELSNKFTKFNQ
nr:MULTISPECIES: tRNA-uridine aminocarboxypropyltransferase [unclassified Marinomonas]